MNDKAVIVTGASRGIGAAAAVWVARFGSRVVINARSPDSLEQTASNIEASGAPVEIVPGDLRDEHVCRELVSKTVNCFGRIDGIINNAGALEPLARIEDVVPRDWDANWRLNVLAPMLLTSAALPHLKQQHGRVVNVSSGAAVHAITGWGAYCAAKAALNIATKVLAVEEPDITAVAFRPGIVDTKMQESLRRRGSGIMDPEEHQRFIRAHEQGDLVPPERVGRSVATLALFAKREWSGDFIALDDRRLTDLMAAHQPGTNRG